MLKLITNARVYAPQDLGVQHLLVGGGKILWMGADAPEFASALDVEIIDANGLRLIPGLVDIHAHITGGGGESGYASRVPAVGLTRFTRAGVTSVVGLLGTDDTTRDTQSLLAEARALRAQGLNAWAYTGGYHVPPVTFTGCVRKDIVNLDLIVGVGELALSDHRSSQPQLAELLRVASDAHVAGLMTGKAGIVHLHLGDGVRGLDLVRQALDQSELPARVFNPTHINRRKALLEEAIELASRGSFVDLTAFPVEEGEDAYSAAEGLQRYLASEAPKGHITVSSDGGGCLPEFDNDGRITHMGIGDPSSLIDTLKELLDGGEDMARVLPAFTENPANLMRFEFKGRITAGGDADLLLLNDDHTIHSVMIGGQWHHRDGQTIISGLFDTPASGH